ncbi:MAG: acyl-CoA desaturase [Rhodothalassiaceae bacterium]
MTDRNRALGVPSLSALHRDYDLLSVLPFLLAHLVCFAAIWTGVHATDIVIAVVLYAARMFGVTGGYHRYFSHRTYKTGRVFQFLLAFLAQSSAQRGVLWWAGTHRHHHRYSDMEEDVHSPVRRSFLYSHVGWIFDRRNEATDLTAVPDLARFPELVWLDRNRYLPAIALGFAVWLIGGWSGLVVGFFWSTVALWHATFCINSLAHVHGSRRYLTADQSRNNWWLALLTFGEGWHNNHHHYQSAACQGFRWFEIDITYYVLRMLSALRIVRDLKTPPAAVVRNEQRLGRAVVEKAARDLLASFDLEHVLADWRARIAEKRAEIDASLLEMSHRLDAHQREFEQAIDRWQRGLDDRIESAQQEWETLVGNLHLPHLPSLAEIRAQAARMYMATPSMNEIVERARELLVEEMRRIAAAPEKPASARV